MTDDLIPAAPDDALGLAVIVASTRQGRFGDTVANWFVDQAKARSDFALDVIDLAETPLPLTLPSPAPPEVVAFDERIEAADAFVVVTPEYNHSFPGPLKNAVDTVHAAWRAKPVAFVSYGGVSGGLRAVEALRLVFAELHATTVRDSVSFAMAHGLFDADGRLQEPAAAATAATRLLDQLRWWGVALREARARRPYGP